MFSTAFHQETHIREQWIAHNENPNQHGIYPSIEIPGNMKNKETLDNMSMLQKVMQWQRLWYLA